MSFPYLYSSILMTDKITFNDLETPEFILKAVSDLGFETPSPIQQSCIPHLLNGNDVLGMAQTGSGKPLPLHCLYSRKLIQVKNIHKC